MSVSDNKGILFEVRTSKHNCSCRVCGGVTEKGRTELYIPAHRSKTAFFICLDCIKKIHETIKEVME